MLVPAYGETETVHGTEFVVTTTDLQIHAATNGLLGKNVYIASGKPYGQINSTNTFTGFYIANGAALDNNAQATINIKYLGLGSNITMSSVAANKGANHVYFNINGNENNAHGFALSGDGWLDIDAAYTDHINVAGMSGGTVYLNEHGMLGGTKLASGNAVEADAVLSLSDIAASPYMEKEVVGDNLWVVTRTLLSGDYTGWTGDVTLNFDGDITGLSVSARPDTLDTTNIGNYWVTASAQGLKVSYVIPEPATATLSLLALAGLCARRRRK